MGTAGGYRMWREMSGIGVARGHRTPFTFAGSHWQAGAEDTKGFTTTARLLLLAFFS